MISGKAIRTSTAPVSNKAPKKKAKNITSTIDPELGEFFFY